MTQGNTEREWDGRVSGKAVNSDSSNLLFENRIGGEKRVPIVDAYFSPKNAAHYLDVSIKFIYERIQSGEIESIAVGNRIKRIKKDTLDKWLTAQCKKHGR